VFIALPLVISIRIRYSSQRYGVMVCEPTLVDQTAGMCCLLWQRQTVFTSITIWSPISRVRNCHGLPRRHDGAERACRWTDDSRGVGKEKSKLEYSECLYILKDGCAQADNILVVAEMQSIPDMPTLRMPETPQLSSGLTCCHAAPPPHHIPSSRQAISSANSVHTDCATSERARNNHLKVLLSRSCVDGAV
jgi:hypothetical protein